MDRNSNKKQENITIRSLITDFFNENLIILQPNFQRQIKRSAAEMNKIIETYVREDCIPNLFIIEKKHIDKNNNEHVLYECLDGQHRLTALKHYITNKPFNNEYLSYESKNGEYVFFDLTDKIKSKFNKLKIFCRQMSSAEKTLFLNTKIQITFISDVKDQHYLENNEFKKLQDGAKIDKTDLIKNSDHPISNFLFVSFEIISSESSQFDLSYLPILLIFPNIYGQSFHENVLFIIKTFIPIYMFLIKQ